jgi:hypothetical protein
VLSIRKNGNNMRKGSSLREKESGDWRKIREVLLSQAFVMADTDYVYCNTPD